MQSRDKKWETYEEVAAFLLNEIAQEFGLARVEGKQKVKGLRSETHWTIDAKGIGEDESIFFIVECRRYTTSRQNQGKIGELAYRILDTGAAGGIIVSPLGIQEGAARVASAENIHNVILDENSTTTEYIMKFLDRVRLGVGIESRVRVTSHLEVMVQCSTCNAVLSPNHNGEYHCAACGT